VLGISEKLMDWLLNSISDLLSVLATDIGHLLSPEWWKTHTVPLFNILMIDLTLAGDNAIVVGMAASRVKPEMRAKVIFWGIAGAVILRIIFASVIRKGTRPGDTTCCRSWPISACSSDLRR